MMRDAFYAAAVDAMERGWIPDALTRRGIRHLCDGRRRELAAETSDAAHAQFMTMMDAGPIAPVPEKANEQHYEVPASFFEHVLGPYRKYSCAAWPNGTMDLQEAERVALEESSARARLEDGLDILELGCGWGSWTLWMAEHYRGSRIVGVSNSASQRASIMERAAERGLDNVEIITADMNEFEPNGQFDRVVSIEMFEHMRNYRALFGRIRKWLRPDGLVFLHVFCHQTIPYEFVAADERDWMSKYFFTGGIMPSAELIGRFNGDFRVRDRWDWSGEYYARTAEAWLDNLDDRRDEVMPILRETYGPENAERWFRRWRVFFMACAELFGFDKGREWFVVHYLLEPTA